MFFYTTNREEIREQQQIAEEIGNAIINIGDPADEEELKNELAAMEQEALDNKMLTAPSAPIASTPQHVSVGKFIELISYPRDIFPKLTPILVKGKAAAAEEDDEEELRQLQAAMAY